MMALYNVQVLCPQFSRTLINNTRMIVLRKDEIMSREGTTQGDNLAMSFYAIGTTLLLRSLKVKCPDLKQISLAYDAVGTGKVKNLKI